MTGQNFKAAWVPYFTGEYDLGVQLAVAEVGHPAGRRKVVAVNHQQAVRYTPTLERYAKAADVVTPRSRRGARGDVVAYVPDWKLLDLAVTSAQGGSLAVIEDFTTSLRGWAQAVGAWNLVARQPTPDPASDEDREAIERIHFEGNNGWSRHYSSARTMTQHLLRDLVDAGRVDAARVVGGVFALGKSWGYLEELLPLVDAAFATRKPAWAAGWKQTPVDSAKRCPMDRVPMIDVIAGIWQCRSCGHEESKP